MGYYDSSAEFSSSVHVSPKLGRALADAVIFGNGIKSDYRDSSRFAKNWQDNENCEEYNCNFESMCFSYSESDGGLEPYVLSEILCGLSKSILALYPDSNSSGVVIGEYSVGDGEYYVMKAGEGKISDCYGGFDEDEDKIDDACRAYLNDSGEEIDDEDFEDALDELFEDYSQEELFSALADYLIAPNCEYPGFELNWTGEGTYGVICASKECDELERVKIAVEKGIITRNQLEGALEEAIKNQDAEVAAILLEWMQKTGGGAAEL